MIDLYFLTESIAKMKQHCVKLLDMKKHFLKKRHNFSIEFYLERKYWNDAEKNHFWVHQKVILSPYFWSSICQKLKYLILETRLHLNTLKVVFWDDTHGIATTHIKRQLVSSGNSYLIEKTTTHIKRQLKSIVKKRQLISILGGIWEIN